MEEPYAGCMLDAEFVLRESKRPLVIGMGGGGDVVGALATAEFARLYDGAEPVLGGLSWERRPIDPVAGPRAASEIDEAEELAPGILLAGPETRVRGRNVCFAESRMAQFLGRADGSRRRQRRTHRGRGRTRPGDGAPALRPARCSSTSAATCSHMATSRVAQPALRRADAVRGGAPAPRRPSGSRRGLRDRMRRRADTRGGAREARGSGAGRRTVRCPRVDGPVADRLEASIQLVPTEASAQAVRAFRGARGLAAIRGGARTLELSPIAALTVYLDVEAMMAATGRLADAVAGADEPRGGQRRAPCDRRAHRARSRA